MQSKTATAWENENAFPFLRINERDVKPRKQGLTEIRGPFYRPIGLAQLNDILEFQGPYVDSFKYACCVQRLMPRRKVRELNDLCHQHDVMVSGGGGLEFVVTQGPKVVDQYLGECRELGFDMVEVSTGLIKLSTDDCIRLSKKVQSMGLKAKPEVNLGGAGFVDANAIKAAGVLNIDPSRAIDEARRQLDAGAYMVMVESEGITENMPSPDHWRTDVIARFASDIGLEHLMFEAADPEVFAWYMKNFGPEVNLFVDHTQILQLEAFRSGVWGFKDFFGRIYTYKG
jgi:phosphosulfolactate synthase (CoM biosynthesis protein A)